jgi:hypothetical protein
MKKIISLCLLSFVLTNSGCVSYYAHRNWKEAQEKKAVRVEADGEAVMVGVDLTQITYLKDNWKIALGAGVVDAVLLYYTYDWVDSLNDGSSSSGNRNNSVTISGNDESSISVNISGDSSTDTRNDNDNSNNSFY